jgi:hypothetical protein
MTTTNPWTWDPRRKGYYIYNRDEGLYVYEDGTRRDSSGRVVEYGGHAHMLDIGSTYKSSRVKPSTTSTAALVPTMLDQGGGAAGAYRPLGMFISLITGLLTSNCI